MKKIAKLLAALVVGTCLVAGSASAHQLWLNMTDYTPALWQHPKYAPVPRAKTVVFFGWGHSYPMADFISDHILAGLERIEPDGTRVKMEIPKEGFRAIRIDMDTPGARVFASSVNPAYYGPVEGKEDFYEIYYEQYAKALVSVLPEKTFPLDGPGENPFIKPIGQKVEIVPQTNPNRLQPGDTLEVQVLLEGKPAKDYNITATSLYAPNAEPQKAVTDGNGKASLKIGQFYGPWIVVASHTFPATGEFAKKCNNFHYTATMTFAVPFVRTK